MKNLYINNDFTECVIHADYYGRRGIVIEKEPEQITIANPGILRIGIKEAMDGGISDPRNPTIFKMFALIDIGERAGSGLFNIKTVWANSGWAESVLIEQFNPERTTLYLPIELFETSDKFDETSDKLDDKKDLQDFILNYIKQQGQVRNADIVSNTKRSYPWVRQVLTEMVIANILEPHGANKNRYYTLKNK